MRLSGKYKIPECVRINRNANGTVRFLDVFGGFDKVGAVKGIFGRRTGRVLSELMIRISPRLVGYLWVDDKNGRVVVVSRYLRRGDAVHLYLDAVHELVHIRQHLNGEKLFHYHMNYVDWPTEIEAYRITVKEAKRLGLKRNEIRDYLNVFWVTKGDMERMYKHAGV
jgi:hypothetical protein